MRQEKVLNFNKEPYPQVGLDTTPAADAETIYMIDGVWRISMNAVAVLLYMYENGWKINTRF